MKVILRNDVPNLGKEGDLVNVRDGYARNYLFPRKLAVPATASNLKHLSDIQKQRERSRMRMREKAKEYATRIENLILKTGLPIGKEGSFGRITASDIADLLAKEGIFIDKRWVVLEEPLKSPGVYDIPIRLEPEIKTVLKLWVMKEEK